LNQRITKFLGHILTQKHMSKRVCFNITVHILKSLTIIELTTFKTRLTKYVIQNMFFKFH